MSVDQFSHVPNYAIDVGNGAVDHAGNADRAGKRAFGDKELFILSNDICCTRPLAAYALASHQRNERCANPTTVSGDTNTDSLLPPEADLGDPP
jgi:hypothetical protein